MKITTSLLSGAALALCILPSSALAGPPAYKADKMFGDKDLKAAPTCISVDAKDQLHVLSDDGTVTTFDPEGKMTGSFKSAMSPTPTTMTVADGKIYLFNTRRVEKIVESRGKKIKQLIPDGIGCSVYDPAGTKVSDLNLPEAMSAADAHFIGNELAVGDLKKSQIVFYEVTGNEGKVTRKIDKGFRLCCGIFDFAPGSAAGSIMVANLGAFKVQTYVGGEKTVEFGQRGEKPEEFHGCCNPVNVGCLADGAIITVEKSPTRVKIFDKDGKESTKVTGLTELVEGCSTIPIAVDSKGTIYLASDTKKAIVKCVPGVSDKPEPAEPKEQAMPAAPELSAGMKAIIEKVGPLMEANEYDKAKTEAEAILKAHPEMSDDEKANITLGIGVTPLVEKGDADGATKLVDAVVAAYPKSGLVKQAEQIKASIKLSIEAAKGLKKEEAEQPEEK